MLNPLTLYFHFGTLYTGFNPGDRFNGNIFYVLQPGDTVSTRIMITGDYIEVKCPPSLEYTRRDLTDHPSIKIISRKAMMEAIISRKRYFDEVNSTNEK